MATGVRAAEHDLPPVPTTLLEASGDVNHSEVFWLRDNIQQTRAQLGGPSG